MWNSNKSSCILLCQFVLSCKVGCPLTTMTTLTQILQVSTLALLLTFETALFINLTFFCLIMTNGTSINMISQFLLTDHTLMLGIYFYFHYEEIRHQNWNKLNSKTFPFPLKVPLSTLCWMAFWFPLTGVWGWTIYSYLKIRSNFKIFKFPRFLGLINHVFYF